MAQAPPNLSSLFSDLNRFSQNQEYERALKVTNKILQESPGEETAFHCKVVCQIKLDRFDDALTAIHKEKKLASLLKFERAYCEYRLNRTQDALTTLRSVENPDNRVKELLAQVLYRLEDYRECYDLYRELIKHTEDDYDEERKTNLAAVVASLQLWDEDDMEDHGLSEDSYELCYNSACYLVGKDLKAAEEKLRKAEVLCRKTFIEDDPEATDDEIDEEMGIIRVQLGYVLQKQRRNEEALQMYNQVLKTKPSDVTLTAVTSNNIVTLNKDQNVFDSKKKMKAATADSLKHKLSSKQHRSINVNQCLLHLYMNQGEQCHRLASTLKSQNPDLEAPVLIEAAQYVRDKQVPKAVQCLQDFAQKHPEQSTSIKLVIAQLHLTQGAIYQACDALKLLGDLQYKPGVVSALVTLYRSQEDTEAVAEVLDLAIKWYKSNKPKSPDLMLLMKASAKYHLKNGNPQKAAKLLDELHKSYPEDPRFLAQLISAYSQFDTAKAQAISSNLPSVAEIAARVDVEALETGFSTIKPRVAKKTGKAEASPAAGGSGDALVQKKRTKKKKGKLPKNCDPNAELDAERWLPRRERSYYRGKRKDRRKDVISKGTQGATGSGGESLDASKPASGPSSEASSPVPGSSASSQATASPKATPTPTPTAPQGPRQQKPAQANKKKKKKGGGKW